MTCFNSFRGFSAHPEAVSCLTCRDLEGVRSAYRVLIEILTSVRAVVQKGVPFEDLDRYTRGLILSWDAQPLLDEVNGFSGCVCVNNDCGVAHGPPRTGEIVREGLVKIDCAIRYRGWVADSGVTVSMVDQRDPRRHLAAQAEAVTLAGCTAVRIGARADSIVCALRKAARDRGVSLLPGGCGHGVGRNLHQPPWLGLPVGGSQHLLRPGMVLTLEPTVTFGPAEVALAADGWTLETRQHVSTATFEHVVALTENGPVLLTEGLIRNQAGTYGQRRDH